MNKYEILERIGEGEYGVVLKAKNKQTGQLVAIKKFKEDDSDEQNKKVILRQVKILKMITHENVIQLKEAFRKKGKIYLVCEYVQKNLLQILDEGPINPNLVRNYALQLIKGIAFMHSLNIIHRDVKPENVLISKNGKVKICDLGFARIIPSNKIMTDYVATRWYRPPELLIGRDDYDKCIDLWSIGCVIAEIIDGEPLFPGQNDLDQLYLIQKCLGPLTPQHQEHFLKNPKFIGMKFPEIHNLESIDRRYFGKIDKQGLDLLKKMLRMDPKNRITAQQALNHPYFHRSGSYSQIQTKRIKYEKSTEEKREDIQAEVNINQSNHLQLAKGQLVFNNFLQQRGITPKQQKIGINKVTGLTKIKKAVLDHVNQRQNNLIKDEENPNYTAKGKSLGNKKVIGSNVRDKYGAITEKNGPKPLIRPKNIQILKKADEEYYEQKWEDEEQQTKQIIDEKEEIEKMEKIKKNEKSGHFIKQIKDTQESPKKEEMKKSKIMAKNYRRDNFSIVFNANTYNLNLVDPYN